MRPQLYEILAVTCPMVHVINFLFLICAKIDFVPVSIETISVSEIEILVKTFQEK